MRSLPAAWAMMTGDPIGVLVPSGVWASLTVIAGVVARQAWQHLTIGQWAALIVALFVARVLLGIPLRSLVIAAGARSSEIADVSGWVRSVALAPVGLLRAGVELCLIAPCLGLPLLLVPAATLRDTPSSAALLLAMGLMLAVTASVLVRAVFAYAAIEAVVGRQSPHRALWVGIPAALRDLPLLVSYTCLGDLAIALGAIPCGAGTLPGYPLADLIILARWSRRSGQMES